MTQTLPSWRDTATRTSVVEFLNAAEDIPVVERVAVFDNDGTLWSEKPQYAQISFFIRELAAAVRRNPALGEREEYAALLSGDMDRIARYDLPRLAQALVELFVGMTPEQFSERVRSFVFDVAHPRGVGTYADAVYQPMLGRRPVLAAGNSAGDRDMMEWATAGTGPSLALQVNHDDADREASYESVSSTLEEHEPIVDVGLRLDWTIVSMNDDWSTVFARA